MKRATLFSLFLFTIMFLGACANTPANTPTVTGPALIVPTAPTIANLTPAPADVSLPPHFDLYFMLVLESGLAVSLGTQRGWL